MSDICKTTEVASGRVMVKPALSQSETHLSTLSSNEKIGKTSTILNVFRVVINKNDINRKIQIVSTAAMYPLASRHNWFDGRIERDKCRQNEI